MTEEPSPGQTYKLAKPQLDVALENYWSTIDDGLKALLADYYITGRVKAARSLIRKMRATPNSPRTWDSIQDKVGLRVICSTKADVRRADKWLSASALTVVERTVKTDRHDKLFYPGVHFIVEDPSLKDHVGAPILCEVQLRTRAQDAWSVVSHKFLYKGLIEPPDRMKRVISRLTVVVEMFDDDVQRMMKKRRKLPMYRPATMLEALDEQYEAITGEPSGGLPDLDLMLVLTRSYTDEEREKFEQIIDEYCKTERARLVKLLAEHQPESPTYLDSRDWLFCQPEILTVLERAKSRPYLLTDAIADTDIEQAVRSACVSAGSPLAEK